MPRIEDDLFEAARRLDGSIDLVGLWNNAGGPAAVLYTRGHRFLKQTEDYRLIHSRQTAALALAMADALAHDEDA